MQAKAQAATPTASTATNTVTRSNEYLTNELQKINRSDDVVAWRTNSSVRQETTRSVPP